MCTIVSTSFIVRVHSISLCCYIHTPSWLIELYYWTNPFSVRVRLIYDQTLHIIIGEGSGEGVDPVG